MLDALLRPRAAAALVLLAAAATIGGALAFEHVFGYRPCKLCLEQRYPYYLAMPLAAACALAPARLARVGLVLLGLIFLGSAGLGGYHAGVEWGFFAGPSDCGGAVSPGAGSVDDLLGQIARTRVVSCTEAAWRFLGLSLAGWNGLISLGLAALSVLAAARRPAGSGQGSSSVSQ